MEVAYCGRSSTCLRAGGWHPGLYLKIEYLPYMELVIEAIDEPGPTGLPVISVAHYGEQNGGLMRDPDMCFELAMQNGPELIPFYYRNDHINGAAHSLHFRQIIL